MNDNSLMEKNELSFSARKDDMPTENINKKNHTKIECEEYLFLSDNELDLDDVNNDSVTDAKETKEELKIGPSNDFLVKAGVHTFKR